MIFLEFLSLGQEDVEAWCEAFLSQDSGIIHFHKSGDEILYQIQLMEL